MKLHNAPASIIAAILLIAAGASFNFVIGLILALAPEILPGVDAPTVAGGAPSQLILISGVACIAFGFVCVWVIREIINRSPLILVMVYTLSGLNILFGIFRLPLGLITISINLMIIFFVQSKSAKQWLNSPR
jgi:hypothetical protein